MSKMSNFVDKLSNFIVKRKIYFIAGFLVLLIVCGCLIPQVKINYNLTEYLPKDSEITKAFDISSKEFGSNEVIMVMLENVEKSEIQTVVASVGAVKGVKSASYKDYNNEKKAILLDVMFADKADYDDIRASIKGIRAIDSAKPAYFTGMVMNDLFVQDTTSKETTKILLFLIPIILLVLIFTSKSWLDPLICLGVMGVAIVISMGTNIVFTGGVSFITQSILAALTMAISMDYSIFLLHAFRDELDKGAEPKTAVVEALKKSFTTITIGSLTTVAGFFAMLFMRFALGFDMGMVFAKTIVIALLTVLLLMPGILLIFNKAIRKTTHRNFFPSFRPIGKFAVKARWVTAALAIVILVPAVFGQFNNNFIYGFSSMTNAEDAQIYKEKEKIKANFNIGNQLVVLFEKDGDLQKEVDMMTSLSTLQIKNKDAEGKEIEEDLLMPKSLSYAQNINNTYIQMKQTITGMHMPFDYTLNTFEEAIQNDTSQLMVMLGNAVAGGVLPAEDFALLKMLQQSKPMFYHENYGRVILELNLEEEGSATFGKIEEIKGVVNKNYKDKNYFYGLSQVAYDIKDVMKIDYIIVTAISVAAIFLLILISFRKFSIPLILMFVIELGIFVNMAIPFFAGISLSFIAYLIISSVQLGCTIDYAILMISKYQAYRQTLEPKAAAAESLYSGAASIFTSGGILTIVGLLINIISSNQLISETGGMLWRAGLLSMLFVFILLPGLFVIFDRFIMKRKKTDTKLTTPPDANKTIEVNASEITTDDNAQTSTTNENT